MPVSKTKPASYLLPILSLPSTERGPVVFGENYMQECISKLGLIGGYLPEETKFAFIGQLQSNKINKLLKAGAGGKLVRIESVWKPEHVGKIGKAFINNMVEGEDGSMEVMVQVDTSGEESKGGLSYNDVEGINGVIEEIGNTEGVQVRRGERRQEGSTQENIMPTVTVRT